MPRSVINEQIGIVEESVGKMREATPDPEDRNSILNEIRKEIGGVQHLHGLPGFSGRRGP